MITAAGFAFPTYNKALPQPHSCRDRARDSVKVVSQIQF